MTTATAAFAIRRYAPEDQGAVLELLRLSLGETPALQRRPEFWRWKHEASPFGPSFAWVACAPDGRVIGLRALMRWRFRAGGREVAAVRAVDTATHPAFRRGGVFSALTRHALEEVRRAGVELVFNTPNGASLPGYLKLGWRPVAAVRPLVRVLHYPRFLLGLARARLRRQPSGAPALALRAPVPTVGEVLVRGDALEPLLRQGDDARLATPRSPGYLAWRYAAHPFVPYYAVTAEERGRVVGLLVVRGSARFGLREVMVEELLLARPDEALAHGLLGEVRRSVAADHLVACFAPGSFQRCALARWGFREAPLPGARLVVRPLREGLAPDPARPEAWALTLGDLEVF